MKLVSCVNWNGHLCGWTGYRMDPHRIHPHTHSQTVTILLGLRNV
jgi:hypothetical protein